MTVGLQSKIITNHSFMFYIALVLIEMKKQSGAQSASLLH